MTQKDARAPRGLVGGRRAACNKLRWVQRTRAPFILFALSVILLVERVISVRKRSARCGAAESRGQSDAAHCNKPQSRAQAIGYKQKYKEVTGLHLPPVCELEKTGITLLAVLGYKKKKKCAAETL
ncbi:unnamed protein product [Amoebophrya sp. A25]|nr:unnamed protein product [Amoebophrya sp. A25]|eukprot:GSA25T00004186001.1